MRNFTKWYTEKALNNKALYETIVVHRHKFTRIGGIGYNLHQPKTINPIPIQEVIEAWRKDCNIMIEQMIEQMIYEENPPSFEDIITDLTG